MGSICEQILIAGQKRAVIACELKSCVSYRTVEKGIDSAGTF
jgi:hypothetical protein